MKEIKNITAPKLAKKHGVGDSPIINFNNVFNKGILTQKQAKQILGVEV